MQTEILTMIVNVYMDSMKFTPIVSNVIINVNNVVPTLSVRNVPMLTELQTHVTVMKDIMIPESLNVKHVLLNVKLVQEQLKIVIFVKQQELLIVNQPVHAQMDNGITTEFVKIVITNVNFVQSLQLIVILAQKTLIEH